MERKVVDSHPKRLRKITRVQTLNMNAVNLVNFKITTGTYKKFTDNILDNAHFGKSEYICVANVHMFIEAQKDATFRKIVNHAGIVTPDGKPLSWALRLINGVRQERVAGMDLFPTLLKESAKKGTSVYFYGGSDEMMVKLLDLLKENLPALKIAGAYSPPFRKLTDDEMTDIAVRINNCSPDLVFVALGCPKQEKWMYDMKDKVMATMIGVGGAIPVFAGLQKRAPKWMQRNGLEWLYRLGQEPKRLFKRYAITNSRFVFIILKEFMRKLYARSLATGI